MQEGWYDVETAEAVLNRLDSIEGQAALFREFIQHHQHQDPPQTPIRVFNADESTAPPYAVMQVSGTLRDGSGDRTAIRVTRIRDAAGDGGGYLFNSPHPIEPGGFGTAFDGPEVKAYSTTGGTSGQLRSPIVGTWDTQASEGGIFSYIGPDPLQDNLHRMFVFGGGGGGGGSSSPRIHFRTLAAIVNRHVNVEVTKIEGSPIDPTTGEAISVGDTVEVHDLRNEFPTIQEDGNGVAYFCPELDGTQSGGIEREAFWQIEDCTLPISRVKAYLTECVFKFVKEPYVVAVHTDDKLSHVKPEDADDWRLSCHPCVDIPDEWDIKVDQDRLKYEIGAKNPHGKDGPAYKTSGSGSEAVNQHKTAIVERVTNAQPSDPYNQELRKETPAVEAEWHIVDVEEQFARRVYGTISGTDASAIIPTDWVDGAEPDQNACGNLGWEFFCDLNCELDEACITGRYVPEEHKYVLDSANASLAQLKVVEYDPKLRIEEDQQGNKKLCVDKASFVSCFIEDTGDSCIDLYECPDIEEEEET